MRRRWQIGRRQINLESAKLVKYARERHAASGRSKAKDTQRAVGSAAKDSRDAVGTAVKDTGDAVQTAAGKAKTPALVGAATLAALGGGLALGRGSKIKLRKRKRMLGVPVPKRTALGKATKQVGKAVDSAGSAGKQVADWSDGLQERRQKIADAKSTIEKLTDDDSPVAKLSSSKSGAAAIAKRVLS